MPKRKARRSGRAAAWRERLRALFTPRAWLDPWLAALVAVLALVALEPYVWLGALAAELRLQLAIVALLAGCWAGYRREWLRTAGLAAGALVLAWPLGPYLRAARPTPQHGPVLDLIQLHLNDAPRAAQALTTLLRAPRPHVLSLTGVPRADVAALASEARGYRRLPHATNGLLLVRDDIPASPAAGNRAATLRVGACNLGLTQLALPSLFSATAQPARAAAVRELEGAQLAQRHVLIGEFGARADAADLRSALTAHALRDSRLGHGLLATAPATLGALGLPIDQLLLRGWLLVREARTLAAPVAGAHRGLFVTLELTEPRCARGPSR